MAKKLKAFTCAFAVAALSVGIVSSAVVANASLARSDKEAAYDAAVALRESPEWIESFQEALLEGKSPADPVYAAIHGTDMTDGNDEIESAYLEQIAPTSVDSTDVRLTLVHDDSGSNGYNLWSGRFVVDDVNMFAATFTSPETMNCVLLKGTEGRLVYKKGYSVNFKELMATYTYLEGGNKVGNRPKTVDGYDKTLEIKSGYSGSGKLVEKAYYFYMYRGDPVSEYWDVAVVHVVDKDYAATEKYAALPYGNLIDCYTYVDVNSLSDSGSEEN